MKSRKRARWIWNQRATAFLVVVVLAIDGVAVWGILEARDGARQTAREELRLQTAAQARAVEAALATLRGDFLFLSQSPPLAKALSVLASDDPMISRWGRLDVDASLLLFMDAHPAVERLVVRDPERGPLVIAGRRAGAPALMVPEEASARPRAAETLWLTSWPLGVPGGRAGSVEAWLTPSALLASAVPGFPGRLVPAAHGAIAGSEGPAPSEPPAGAIHAAVSEPRFTPPIAWTLERRVDAPNGPLENLASRTLPTAVLNATLMLLALVLGAVTLREVRRSERLEAEKRQHERVRELERQVQHSERLASVGRLAAGIAHEINNPLEGMSNYLSVMEQDLRDARSADALQLVPLVREGLHRAASITRQVLRYADPGRAPKDSVDLSDVLRSAAAFVRGNPAFRGVDLRIALPQAPLAVLGNRTTLDQLFLNLLVNACEAQEGRGTVELAAHRQDDRVVVSVADSGPGIPEATRRNLFEPFTSSRGSTGLGLSVCHGIVREHGGEILGENRPEGGARFRVAIPLLAEGVAMEQA